MRADRLVAVLLLMQARERVTAAEVATELEVSVATARRDLEALSTAGVPVYSQPGRGGGWSLVGGARTDLTGLTSTEARTLFLLASPGASQAPPVRSALRKLTQALPAPLRADAEAAADAVVVDSARWGERSKVRPALVELLQDAVVRRRRVVLRYDARAGRMTERIVDPWGLADKDDVWYLVAGTEKGQRTFRVDRIVEATLTDHVAERPAGFTCPESGSGSSTRRSSIARSSRPRCSSTHACCPYCAVSSVGTASRSSHLTTCAPGCASRPTCPLRSPRLSPAGERLLRSSNQDPSGRAGPPRVGVAGPVRAQMSRSVRAASGSATPHTGQHPVPVPVPTGSGRPSAISSARVCGHAAMRHVREQSDTRRTTKREVASLGENPQRLRL